MVALCCLVADSSEILLGVDRHWDHQVECVSRHWKLILENRNELEGKSAERFHGGEECRVHSQVLSRSLIMRIDKEEKLQHMVCYRARDGAGVLALENGESKHCLPITRAGGCQVLRGVCS